MRITKTVLAVLFVASSTAAQESAELREALATIEQYAKRIQLTAYNEIRRAETDGERGGEQAQHRHNAALIQQEVQRARSSSWKASSNEKSAWTPMAKSSTFKNRRERSRTRRAPLPAKAPSMGSATSTVGARSRRASLLR